MITALLIGAGALWLLRRKQKAIGKVERIKRRIYKEVSMAQGEGVDFSKKFDELTAAEIDALQAVGEEVAWKQSKRSIESGKSYAEAYFNSLRRAWNAVSGVQGIGRAWNIKDANGNTVLTWIEDAAHHVEAEAVPIEPEKPKAKKKRKADEKNERAEFAERFIEHWLQEHHNSWLARGEENNIDVPIPNLNNITGRELLISEFANGTLKWKQDKRYSGFADNIEWYTRAEDKRTKHDWEGDDKGWIPGGKKDNASGQLVFEMIEGWKNRHITDGFAREDLNDIRIALLDKAKHMEVVFYDNETQKWVNVSGEDRYNYLDEINWIMMVHQSYHNSAADKTETTIYPIRSFNEQMEAELFGWKPRSGRDKDDVLTSTRTIKVIPIFDVDVKSITGII